MCTAVGKYLKGLGWVIAKNRDQDYVSDTSFLDRRDPKVGEILLLDDKDIEYRIKPAPISIRRMEIVFASLPNQFCF